MLVEGVDVGADSLALDVIADVGPRGHFLAQKHTRQRVRDIWIPGLTHPRPPKEGEPLADVRKRARAKLDRILAEHQPEPLEEAVQAELLAILDAAQRELGT
jgi:trimethylamine--corrinoid protein Co-methyltransferase